MSDSLYFPIIFLIGALVCIYVGFSGKSEADFLEQFGVTVQSLPLGEYTEIIENGTLKEHEISPQYISESGASHKCTGSIDRSMFAQLQQSAIVNIRYLPNNPSICEIVGGKRLNYSIALFIGIITFLGSFIALYRKYTYI